MGLAARAGHPSTRDNAPPTAPFASTLPRRCRSIRSRSHWRRSPTSSAPIPNRQLRWALYPSARSPLPGQSLWLHPGQVQNSLKQQGWDAHLFEITANGPVKVIRNHATLPPEMVSAAVVEFIERHAPWDREQIKIRPIRYRQSHQLPPWKGQSHGDRAEAHRLVGRNPFQSENQSGWPDRKTDQRTGATSRCGRMWC